MEYIEVISQEALNNVKRANELIKTIAELEPELNSLGFFINITTSNDADNI